jgi:predicted XRE-type DNA-binding protein
MTTAAQWVEEQIDTLEAEQARVTELAEHETDHWATLALKERLNHIRTHLSDLRRRT